jgi:hypothetical protein
MVVVKAAVEHQYLHPDRLVTMELQILAAEAVVLEMVILQVMVVMVSSSLLTQQHKLCYNT